MTTMKFHVITYTGPHLQQIRLQEHQIHKQQCLKARFQWTSTYNEQFLLNLFIRCKWEPVYLTAAPVTYRRRLKWDTRITQSTIRNSQFPITFWNISPLTLLILLKATKYFLLLLPLTMIKRYYRFAGFLMNKCWFRIKHMRVNF